MTDICGQMSLANWRHTGKQHWPPWEPRYIRFSQAWRNVGNVRPVTWGHGKQMVFLHTMAAQWISELDFWRPSTNLSVHRSSIAPLLHNLRSWVETASLGAHWHVPKGPRYLVSLTDSQRASLKCQKFSDHITKVFKDIDDLQ